MTRTTPVVHVICLPNITACRQLSLPATATFPLHNVGWFSHTDAHEAARGKLESLLSGRIVTAASKALVELDGIEPTT